MNKGTDQTKIQLDWYNVRYRTIALWSLLIFGSVAGGGSYFYYYHYVRTSPQGQARGAIHQAEGLLEQAGGQAQNERLQALHEDARRFLDSARANYDEANYNDARVAAIRSRNFSQKLLDIASGGDTTTKEVRFYKIEGDTKVKRAGQFIWETADPNLPLSVGDQIKTSSDATAQIIYFDGTITTIKPGSLLEIKELYEHPTTKVRKVREKLDFGGVSATLAGSNVAGSFHEVATDTTSARSQVRSEIEIGYDQDSKKTEVRVHSGKAEVATGGKEIQVAPSEMVAVGQDQTLLQKRNIPRAPDLVQPLDQKVFVYDNTDAATTVLVWNGVSGAVRYHLQISRRSLLGELLLDKDDVRSTSVKLPRLKVGSYYWRVATVSPDKVESAFSETRKFKIISTEIRDSQDKVPPRIEVKDFLVFSYQVIINGKTEPGALVSIDGQRVDVFDDGTFTAVIKLRREGKNVLNIVAQDISGNETQIQRTAYVEAF
jgi:hypothetical protein